MALVAYLLAQTDDARFPFSSGEMNGFINAVIAGSSLTGYRLSGSSLGAIFWNAFLDALGPDCDLTAFRFTGTNNATFPVSLTWWNGFLGELEAFYAILTERVPEYIGPIANNCRLPDWLVGNTGGLVSRYWARSSHYLTEAVDGPVTIGIAPFFVNLNTTNMLEHAGDGATTWTLVNSEQTLTIEARGAAHSVASLAGDESFIVPPGPCFEVTATLTAGSGEQIHIQRSAQNEDGSSTAKMAIVEYGGAGDFAVHGNALDNAQIADGTADPHALFSFVDSFNVFSAPPAYILGPTTKRTFALIANSRGIGSFDTMASNTYGDIGQIARALTAQGLAYINMGYGNDSMHEWLASHTYRLPVANLCTDIILGDPTNDFGRVGHSAAETIADYEAMAALFPGKRVWAITSPPIATSSTDGWTTIAGQTVDATFNAKRIAFNAAVRAGLTGFHGYFELADVLDHARDDGRWKVISPDPVTGIGEPTTADGVHELPLGNQTIADSGAIRLMTPTITLGNLGGTFTLPEDAIAGAVAGAITGRTTGSALSLADDAGGRVALSGTNIVRGATALDFETNPSHSFTVRENHADASNRPHDTVLTLTVTDVVIGSELVTNGSFATDTGWTKGANTVISGGMATATAQSSGSAIVQQSGFSLSTANTYRVSFVISGYVGGSVFLRFGNNGVNAQGPLTANGTYSYDIQPGSVSSQDITFWTFGSTTLSIDDVSVKQLY